jgi:hypothetical protein
MKQQFKSEKKIMAFDFERVPKEVIEKQFIIDFFKSLPIEYLKRMINYEVIDYNEKNPAFVSQKRLELLNRLRQERAVLITADIWLDNGIDDLSLGHIS